MRFNDNADLKVSKKSVLKHFFVILLPTLVLTGILTVIFLSSDINVKKLILQTDQRVQVTKASDIITYTIMKTTSDRMFLSG